MKKTSIIMLFIFLNSVCSYAQMTLVTRKIFTTDDSACVFDNKKNWSSTKKYKNNLTYRVTNTEAGYFDYMLNSIKGLSGEMEFFLYKNIEETGLKINNTVDVTINHAGKTDQLKNVLVHHRKTGWYSIGKFKFDGNGKEFIRFKRNTSDKNLFTLALTMRCDWYFDRQMHPQNDPSVNNTPLGFSSTGIWSPQNKGTDSLFFVSNQVGAIAVWHPSVLMPRKMAVYVQKPNLKCNDRFLIYHNKHVSEVNTAFIRQSNDALNNPVVSKGWYKLGEFDFSGDGNEFVKLVKTTSDTSFVAKIYFETLEFDGTLVNRWVVIPKKFEGAFQDVKALTTLEQKEKNTQIEIGFSSIYDEKDIVTSSKNGYTFYGRPYYIKNTARDYFWNPLITEGGVYSVLYYNYYPTKSGGHFTVYHNGKKDKIDVPKSEFIDQKFTKLAEFDFKGGSEDEFIAMTGLDRASEMIFEKSLGKGAILKQRIITGHPYFKEIRYEDTKSNPAAHAISFMVQRGLVKPKTENEFGSTQLFSKKEFIDALLLMMDSTKTAGFIGSFNREKRIKSLVYGISNKDSIILEQGISQAEAVKMLSNTLDLTGKYLNISNIFTVLAQPEFEQSKAYSMIPTFAQEAYRRLVVLGILKAENVTPQTVLNRIEATVLLKEFLENSLQSGPPTHEDWVLTFNDEFNGENIDSTKWNITNQIRFKNLSAKWAENSTIEGGFYKAYNYFDNHLVPYSSGELVSKYTQRHGFFEARYSYPQNAYGSHSSFWSSPKDRGPSGDFNYNEGTYPNGISNNNYFLRGPENFNNFKIKTNYAHDLHTISGCLDSVDLAYGIDGQVSYPIKNYPRFFKDSTKSTDVPYLFFLSTIVTYFDGPLDKDRIDGSYMLMDWVRLYKRANYPPSVKTENFDSKSSKMTENRAVSPAVCFNKPMNIMDFNTENIKVYADKKEVSDFTIEVISPVCFELKFKEKLKTNTVYSLKISKKVRDLGQKPMLNDVEIKF